MIVRLEKRMTIPVSELPPRLQEIVSEGRVIEVEQDGQIVARIVPAVAKRERVWEPLRGSGELLAEPEESVWFEHPAVKR